MLYEFDAPQILNFPHPLVVSEEPVHARPAAIFHQVLAVLPDAESAIVRMAFCQGLTHREIAHETALPLAMIKSRLESGMKKLRAAVAAKASRDNWFPEVA